MGEAVEGREGLLLCFVDVVFGHLEEAIGLAVQSPWDEVLLVLGCCGLLDCGDVSVELAVSHHGKENV